jgi:Cu-Zn family superoxide dismutase
MKKLLWILAPAALLAAGFALPQEKKVVKAVAVVTPTEGNSTNGVVTFEMAGDVCKITYDIKGLKPGKHGFHIHQFGDINCSDGKCAGGHFNPFGKKHGGPTSAERHVGDLGNIEANADGVAKGEMTDPEIKLAGAASIIGRSVMVHGGEDDLKSDPAGNAGARVGDGVVGIAKEE